MGFIKFVLRFGLGLILIGFCGLSFAAFLGFASPLLDALNHFQPFIFAGTLILLILTIFVFASHRWRSGLIALGASGFLASAVIVVPEYVAKYFASPAEVQNQQVIKLMSQNLFGLNIDMSRMAGVIQEQNPDIVTLQEYFNAQNQKLHPQIIIQYPYFARCAGRKHSQIAIYSKTPFELMAGTQCAEDAANNDNPVARLVAKFQDRDGKNYTVITTHLNWPVQINPLFRDDLDPGEKYNALTVRKVTEWKELSEVINKIEGPVVLSGDFNSTSWSYAMRNFSSATGLTRHSLGLMTYPKLLYIRGWRETPAILPIDHFLASDDVRIQSVIAGLPTGSDHLPIFGQFFIEDAQ